MKWAVVCRVSCALVCLASFGASHEKPYDFRARLANVHEANRRDWARTPGAADFAFADGCRILVPAAAEALVARAAEDFRDYLQTSMGVNASVTRTESPDVAVRVTRDPSLAPRAYAIAVTAQGVTLRAADARAAARAFYRLEDRMNLRRAPFLAKGSETRRPMFSPRMSHSGWGCDRFPDAHLAQMAHYGLDAILIFVKGIDETKNLAHNDIADTIRRARRWGLDTYLYSYVHAFAHPDDPGSREIFEKSYGAIAAKYPEAKGIVFVGESCQFPSKDERALPYCYWEKDKIAAHRAKGDRRPLAGWFPCRDYAAWLNAVTSAIHAKAPKMEIVFWSYNWGYHPEDLRLKLIDSLPTDITLQATFEMFERFEKRNGLASRVADYSLAYVGPGRYFSSEAKRARERGMKMYAMSNTGGHTWDFGTIPFDPFPYQWKKRFDAVVRAHRDWNLAGLMENHHYGWWPSFISEISKELYTEGGMRFEELLPAIAARDYGEANAEAVLAVWRDWSAKIVDMHSENENQYGPFRYGPAYPFNAMEPDLKDTDLPVPPMYLTPNYRHLAAPDASLKKQLELLAPMIAAFESGARVFHGIAAGATDAAQGERARRMGDLGEYLARCCLTARHVKEGMMAERARNRAKVEAIAAAEHANCAAALELVGRDSRLGWEPTMLYRGGPDAIRWKLAYLRRHYASCSGSRADLPGLLRQIPSSLDGTMQPCYFWAPEKAQKEAVPLIVGLHTWSCDYRQLDHYATVLKEAKKRGWAFVGPNFRGPNKTPPACGGDPAVQDIVDAVDYAKRTVKIDAARVYIIGGSGGGHMTLLMLGRHPEIFAGGSAFCPITDLARWHADSLLKHPGRGREYARMLEGACGGTPAAKPEEYRHRSPLTHLANARKAGVPAYIVTGIHDGWTGSVPVGHAFRAFNALADAQDAVSEEDIAAIERDQRIPASLVGEKVADPFYSEKMKIHFRRTSAAVQLTIFEGGHGGNFAAGFEFLSRQRKGRPVDWSLPKRGAGAEEKLTR